MHDVQMRCEFTASMAQTYNDVHGLMHAFTASMTQPYIGVHG